MSSRPLSANLAVLAALATLTAACKPAITTFAEENALTSKTREVQAAPRVSGSGVSGMAVINYYREPALLTAYFHFAGVERNNVGARYPVHVHMGLNCGGVDVPVTHDLGAPVSAIRLGDTNIPSVYIYDAPLPIQHLSSGYYLDLHAPDDPTGLPLACAVF